MHIKTKRNQISSDHTKLKTLFTFLQELPQSHVVGHCQKLNNHYLSNTGFHQNTHFFFSS